MTNHDRAEAAVLATRFQCAQCASVFYFYDTNWIAPNTFTPRFCPLCGQEWAGRGEATTPMCPPTERVSPEEWLEQFYNSRRISGYADQPVSIPELLKAYAAQSGEGPKMCPNCGYPEVYEGLAADAAAPAGDPHATPVPAPSAPPAEAPETLETRKARAAQWASQFAQGTPQRLDAWLHGFFNHSMSRSDSLADSVVKAFATAERENIVLLNMLREWRHGNRTPDLKQRTDIALAAGPKGERE